MYLTPEKSKGMKINEVEKATTLAPVECVTAIAADGSLIQIPVSELAKVLETLMTSLSRAFIDNHFSIRNGETKVIGKVNGLMILNFPWTDNYTSMYIVSSKAKKIELIHGNGYIFLDFTFNDSKELLISSRYTGTELDAGINMAYQNIIH